MRITFVHKTANFSGGNRVVATYAERLQRRGHQVCVVTATPTRARPLRKLVNRLRGRTFPESDGRSWLDTLDVPHHVVPSARPITAADVPDADVIVATWWETAEWIAAMPARKGHKAYFLQGIEWTIDDMPVERVKQTWRLPLHKIVIAEFMAEIAANEFGDQAVSYVPNAVDHELFHAEVRGKQATPTVGLMEVGDNSAKGGDVTYAALLEAKRLCPELRGVCFGRSMPPPSRPLPSWVRMQLSPSPDALRALYASCDVFIHGARAEGFGLPLLEAMACRTPVVATPAGAAPELLPSGGGTLVPQEDSRAMAAALVEVTQLSEAAWRERSLAAYERATGYTIDDATRRMEAALERACQPRAFPRASARGDVGEAPPLSCRWPERATLPPEARSAHATRLPQLLSAAQVGADAHESAALEALLSASLNHPATLAALEDLLGVEGLLVDPLAREQGLRHASSGATEGTLRTGLCALEEPPLDRRYTLVVALDPLAIRCWDEGTRALQRETLQPGDALLCLAGLDRALGVQAAAGSPAGTAARYAVAHYYSASPTPDARPLVRERRFDADAPTPRGQLRHALRFQLETKRAQFKRDSKRLYERFLGTY